jgi:hypothetical protein
MTRILFALLGATFLAAVATPEPAFAVKFFTGKNGAKITCTFEDCQETCIKAGGRVRLCPQYCTKTLNERKASGECK